MEQSSTILEINDLSKFFIHADTQMIEVLTGINHEVGEGKTVAIVGDSGSGKSTLLSLLAGLDQPTSGNLFLKGHDLTTMDEEALARFRAEHIGIIFQQFHLMSHLTALENVSLPLDMFHKPDAEERAREALVQVGLDHRQHHFPHQLSGGECQRVAIARAIVIEPAILLADEPTGNLDNQTGEQVADLLFNLVQSNGMTMILVTHNEGLAARCEQQVTLKDGNFSIEHLINGYNHVKTQ